VIDHHALERPAAATEGVAMTVRTVGSCSTLVAETIFADNPEFKDEKVLNLLRWTILTDTSNLSPKIKKATDEDVTVLEKIEKRLGGDSAHAHSRADDFNLIAAAKSDTSRFDCSMLIRKDMKVLRFPPPRAATVTMSTIAGHTCSDVVRREDFAGHVAEHAAAGGHALVVLTGGRDILLYPSKGNPLCEAVRSKLVSSAQAEISVAADEAAEARNAVYLYKANDAYTRKKLLPMVREAVAEALDE